MIYMVDHVYADPASEAQWHAWYSAYLQKLIAVPGIRSAQRFKALGCSPSRYLAMYTVDSGDVFTSEPYRRMGGGGSQSARFHGAYRLWTRNLFKAAAENDPQAAVAIAPPAVASGQHLLVFDREAIETIVELKAQPTWLEAVGLHMTTKYRAFLVLDGDANALNASVKGSFLYAPFTAVLS